MMTKPWWLVAFLLTMAADAIEDSWVVEHEERVYGEASLESTNEDKERHPAPTGTNFQHHIPFEFSFVFLIGGFCDDPAEWYSKWVETARLSLKNIGLAVTKTICAQTGVDAYSRQFNLDALREVEEIVGDKLNETFVITVAVGLESDWTPLADLLRRGMAFFHAREDPHNFNIAQFGLSAQDVLYFYFQWDEVATARGLGTELCRLKGGSQQLKVAKLYRGNRNGGLNYRVDIASEAFQKACPNTEVVELWQMYSTVSENAYKAKLVLSALPDVVLTTGDGTAEVLLEIAKKFLTPDEYSRFGTTGWDNTHPALLNEKKILVTADQNVHNVNQGLWKIMGTVITAVQQSGLNSTKAVQDELELGDTLTIVSDTLTVSSDQVGYLLNDLLKSYDKDSPPVANVEISTGLYDVSITEMTPFEGKFDTVLWMRMSWHDPRLKWNPIVFAGEMTVDSDTIWTPQLFFRNTITQEDLYTAPASVKHDGTVVLERNFAASFLCSTTEELLTYPFETYHCSIDLGAPHGVLLNQEYGFEVVESDPHFATTSSIPKDYVQQDDAHYMVFFDLSFERRLFTAYVRLIIPAVLINMIGFMAFWIPTASESVALGITSLLCSLAIRDSVDMPDTADITWSELFMMINVIYQASVMFIIWVSYGGSKKVKANLHRCFRKVHPKKFIRVFIAKDSPKKKEASPNAATADWVASSVQESDRKLRRRRVETNSTDGENLTNDDEENGVGHLSISGLLPPANQQRDRPESYPSRSQLEQQPCHEHSKREAHIERILVSSDSNSCSIQLTEKDKQADIGDVHVGSAENINDEDKDKAVEYPDNVNWIGRWFIVPSYIIVLVMMMVAGCGFK